MTEFLKLCNTRSSTRKFTGRPVEREKLISCLEAGRLAPSACNSQPWSFAVAVSEEAIEACSNAARQLDLNEFTTEAGAFIAVIEEYALLLPGIQSLVDSQYFAASDAAVAAAYICLEASALGLGVCQIGMFDREIIRKALGIPKEKRIVSLLALGYPAQSSKARKVRKALDTISRFV